MSCKEAAAESDFRKDMEEKAENSADSIKTVAGSDCGKCRGEKAENSMDGMEPAAESDCDKSRGEKAENSADSIEPAAESDYGKSTAEKVTNPAEVSVSEEGCGQNQVCRPANIVGVMGGIGVGKSAVLEILRRDHGAVLIEADAVGHDLMRRGGELYRREVEHFGEEILGKDGEIDRKKLGAIVFSDNNKLEELNSISHPLIREEIGRRIREALDGGAKLVVIEAALPEEAGMYDYCGTLIAVTAPEEVRVARLAEGRGYTPERSREVMRNQRGEADFAARADAVIDNGGSLEETARQLEELLG